MRVCGNKYAHPSICTDVCGGYRGRLSGVDDFVYRYYIGATDETIDTETETNTENTEITEKQTEKIHNRYLSRPLGCLRGCILSPLRFSYETSDSRERENIDFFSGERELNISDTERENVFRERERYQRCIETAKERGWTETYVPRVLVEGRQSLSPFGINNTEKKTKTEKEKTGNNVNKNETETTTGKTCLCLLFFFVSFLSHVFYIVYVCLLSHDVYCLWT